VSRRGRDDLKGKTPKKPNQRKEERKKGLGIARMVVGGFGSQRY